MTDATANAYDFGLNGRLAVSRRFVGKEQEPVVVIDGLMRHPAALVEYAAREVTFSPAGHATGGYPGIRAPAPLNYVSSTVRALDRVLREAFGLGDVVLARAECNFSLVTLPPGDLSPLQRIPHIDTVDPLQFAFLHFLCDAHFGGTAFYRHRATGFETLTAERQRVYEEMRDRELAGPGGDPSYIVGDTEHYEQTASVEARVDRMLIYRSRLLHSGRIGLQAPLSSDPRRGRLTANVFVNYRPAEETLREPAP
jgi:hypothetical protein